MPRAATGRPRAHPVPTQPREAAEDVLARARWRRVAWRAGTKGPLAARFAAVRVVVADGPKAPRTRRLPGDAAWLVGEWRRSGERKYYLASHAPTATLRQLASAIKARWVCEQAHQQLKEELGPRPLRGAHLARAAPPRAPVDDRLAFLQHLRLAAGRRAGGKPDERERAAAPAHAPGRAPPPRRPTPPRRAALRRAARA
jgi:hypothetical protein